MSPLLATQRELTLDETMARLEKVALKIAADRHVLLEALRAVAASSFLPTVGTTRAIVEAAIAKATGVQS